MVPARLQQGRVLLSGSDTTEPHLALGLLSRGRCRLSHEWGFRAGVCSLEAESLRGAGLGDTLENAVPCLQSFHGQKEAETLMESDAAPLYPSPHSRILVALPSTWKLWGQVQTQVSQPSALWEEVGVSQIWGWRVRADSWRAEGHPFLLGCSVVLVFSPALTKLTVPRMFPLPGHTEAIGLVSLGLFVPQLPNSLTLRAS